jgi:hypothetical protein
VHVYLGVAAGILLMVHAGTHPSNWLTTALHTAFDFALATGLFGSVVYYYVPRMMTSIEEEPLLLEDLCDRRQQLLDEIARIQESKDRLRSLVQSQVSPRFRSLRFLLRQYIYCEELQKLRDEAPAFLAQIQDLSVDERAALQEIIKDSVVLRRVESLIYLHRLLKLWLTAHIISTTFMLVLMVVHIVQVVFFSTR